MRLASVPFLCTCIACAYAGLGEITRDYVDKMPLAALQEAQSVVRLDRDQSKIQSLVYTPPHSEPGPKTGGVPW